MRRKSEGSRVGDQIVAGLQEMAAYLRGDVECESYELSDDELMTPAKIQEIRRKVASSTKEFEQRFHISARTMEAYEQGRRQPDDAMLLLLRVLDQEPDAVRRVLRLSA